MSIVERGTAQLEGDLVRLRAMTDQDVEVLARWNVQPDVAFLHGASLLVRSESNERQRFTRWSAGDDPLSAGFSIETRHQPQLVGALLVKSVGPGRGSLHIMLGPDHLGRGYGSDGARLAVRVAFHELNLHRLELQTLAVNERAQTAFARAGFAVEGRLRDARLIAGEWHDEVIMGILNDQYSPSSTRA